MLEIDIESGREYFGGLSRPIASGIYGMMIKSASDILESQVTGCVRGRTFIANLVGGRGNDAE